MGAPLKTSLWDEKALFEAMIEKSINLKHARTLWRNIIQQGCIDYREIKDLPKSLVALLDAQFALTTSVVAKRSDAKDGSTTKLLIQLQSGKKIEACIMRYGDVEFESFPDTQRQRLRTANGDLKFKSSKRATLCVSSQVGCAMACTFCATGTMGLDSNLTSGEILEQLYHASKIEKIRGIVFMGMGEPLDNYNAVIKAIEGMTDTSRFSISAARISISTVGVVPRIKTLIRDAPMVGLALSLHAPTLALRTQIVPTTKAWSIESIMTACDAFVANQNKSSKKRRHVLIEYVLIKDINDSEKVAHGITSIIHLTHISYTDLGLLLKDRDVLLNVIPYNPTAVAFDYHPPSSDSQARFVKVTRDLGVKTLLRQTMGQDIASACGQLVIEDCTGDIEDLGSRKVSSTRKPIINSSRKNRISNSKLDYRSSSLMSSLPWIIFALLVVLLYRTLV